MILLAGAAVFTRWLSRELPPAVLRVSWPDFLDSDETWHCDVNTCRFLVIVSPGGTVSVRAEAESGAFHSSDIGTVEGISTSFAGPEEGRCTRVRFVGVDDEKQRVECRLAILSVKRGSPGEILGEKNAGAYSDPKKSKTKKIRTHPDRYAPPQWWVPVSGLELWPISKDFLLGDLMGDRLGRKSTPPWIALDYRLVWKLQAIQNALGEQGIAYRSMKVISGFREPKYNRSKRIGGSRFSRHQYGDAADFIVDRNRDGKWDDLDGDGDVDFGDVKPVARLVEDLEMDGYTVPGGIGAYRGSDGGVLGSVHVDCRGFPARWGSGWRKGKRTAIEWWSEKYKAPDESDEGNSKSP